MPRRRKKKISHIFFYTIMLMLFMSFVYVTYNDNTNSIKVSEEELNGIKV